MIITVTLNPAIDQTIEIDRLVEGDTNRVAAIRWDIGGKGINVARMLKELGYEPLASGFAPGDLGRMIEDSLLDAGIGCEFIFVAGETRTNITILDRETHRDTVLAAAGPKVTQHAISLLRARLNRRLRPHGQSWLVLAGSIPPGCDPALYADLLGMAAERGAYSAVDADGEVVAAILSGGAAPNLLKLNEHEAGRLLGRTIEDEASAIEAARTLQAWGLEQVVITRGGGGAVALTPEGGFRVAALDVEVRSAVGAGDAFLAGLIFGLVRNRGWAAALATATAAGAATCLAPGTALGRVTDARRLETRVRVERLREPAPHPAHA